MEEDFEVKDEDVLLYFWKNYEDYFIKEKEYPRLRFVFLEQDSKKIIEEMYLKNWIIDKIWNVVKEDIWKLGKNDIEEPRIESDIPTIFVKDTKKFFENLIEYCKEEAKVQYKYGFDSSYHARTQTVMLDLFLRATSEDFSNIELFIERQTEMLKNSFLNRFIIEQEIGTLEVLGNYRLTAQLRASKLYDENSLEVVFRIYNENNESFELPVVRYGVFTRDEHLICSIGSIQNKEESTVDKVFEQKRYKVNSSVEDRSLTEGVEPKKLISLLAFIDLMIMNGITEFEGLGLTVLDYRFHEISSELSQKRFYEKYSDESIPSDENSKSDYLFKKKAMNKFYKKQDYMIDAKTTKMLKIIERLIYHYSGSKITAYPFQADSNVHFIIPEDLKDENIIGDLPKELFSLIQNKYIPLDYNFEDCYDETTGIFDVEKLKGLSEKGNSFACHLIGIFYKYGIYGFKRDSKLGVKYFKIAQIAECLAADIELLPKMYGKYDKYCNIVKRINSEKIKTAPDSLQKSINRLSMLLFFYLYEKIDREDVESYIDKYKDTFLKQNIYNILDVIDKDKKAEYDDVFNFYKK